MSDVITGNYYDKYGSTNPLVRWVVGQYLSMLFAYLDRRAFNSVFEAGCGEGEIIDRIVARYTPARLAGMDIDHDMVDALKVKYPAYSFMQGSLTDLHTSEPYDVVLCLEVLEHIPDYSAAIARLREMDASRYVLSVPNEPFFRLANLSRFKYLRRLGNTPGHCNSFTYPQFRSLVSRSFPGHIVETSMCWIWSFAYLERSR
jgi:2-polyprenyl-3-methyl-5-hydroxy-6-metoxy-1,4-benzoquinol methylase